MNRREAIRRTATITGVAISSSAITAIMQGCQSSGDPGWKPQFLTSDEYKVVSAIADIILPASDTPGALDLNIPQLIDLLLADNLTEIRQQSFREGYLEFEEVMERSSVAFEEISPGEQVEIIKELEDEDNTFSDTIKSSFYRLIKQYTIFGYYTSEYVMENILDYHAIPGRYEGCIPFGKDGKLFVTN